ncbi:MAG: OmpA family protein [Blastocatellales bacterium]
MSDSPLRIVPNQPDEPDQPENVASTEAAGQDEMAELRRLLVEPEQVQINNVLDRLNNPRVRAREMSRLLSEAVKLRAAQDDSLTEALAPTVVTSFHNSVKKDPRPVAEAISPLMGPAIRRAISAALNSMVQTFDQALKHSLSWQGVKWRIEAMRTGQSFAEVVMLHTLVYRVEQVFLIHKRSGVRLHHVAAPSAETQDADIVSGMMTAIQEAIRSFARDSFGSAHDEHIDTLHMGDREVWFEPSPQAVLAVVVRGKAPESLRGDFFAPAIEAIQYEQREALESFDGDTAPFELSRPHLESCLLSKYEGQTDPAKFKIPRYVWVSLALLLLAAATWAFFAWRDSRRWENYLSKLEAQPGIIVGRTGNRDGRFFVTGSRDPNAADPETILKEQTALDPNDVISSWRSHLSLEPRIVLARAKSRLEPPSGVTLKFDQGKLSAEGAAQHQWIAEAQRMAPLIPGVAEFDDTNLIDNDLDELRLRIEQQVIRFVVGKDQITSGQNQALKDLADQIRTLAAQAPSAGRVVRIEIIGHTDTEGDETTNQRLSDDRSARILSMLTTSGVSKEIFFTRGAASKEPVRPETSESDKEFNRSVSFKISLLNPHRASNSPGSPGSPNSQRN